MWIYENVLHLVFGQLTNVLEYHRTTNLKDSYVLKTLALSNSLFHVKS